MTGALRVAAAVFLAAIVQTAIIDDISILRGTPDLVLVLVVAVAFRRGSLAAAMAGFAGGLLVELGTLEPTLGVLPLVLAVAGYWAGRYAETTGRGRAFAPYAAVLVLGLLARVGWYLVHFLLGDAGDASIALGGVLQSAVFDLLLALLVMGPIRLLIGRNPEGPRPQQMGAVVA